MRKPGREKNNSETNKGAWSKEEDQKLVDYIRKHGEGCWRSVPQATGLLRCGKSCRLRWVNYLRPDVKRGNFGEDEEELIIKLHALLGNRWSLIAGRLPGRTDNEVKNYWNTHLRKKLIKMGLDPNKHRIGQVMCFSKRVICDKLQEDHNCSSVVNSDCRSESGSANCLPDLNLDLTIGPPIQRGCYII